MTKARARERAKARKGKKRVAPAEAPEQQPQAEKFAPGASSVQGPKMEANTKNFAAASRGAARSK